MDVSAWVEKLRQLESALEALAPEGEFVGLPAPGQEEWYRLLRYKLLPQLTTDLRLVVAIIGGTNIGKSLIFNHLAGEMASAVSPLAARTKHPVCLAPPENAQPELLGRLFEGFELRPWRSADDPLLETDEHLLFWRPSQNVPPRLLLLDTPDVDSDMPINWERARRIRQVADVLIAVLTQQKYNDAAVKQFFREAAQADKPVIVLFNQCYLEADRAYWPLWLQTFCQETGADPMWVYVSPADRAAADRLQLPFYDVGRDGRNEHLRKVDLREELAALHFEPIKLRTLRGALRRVLDQNKGLGGYLSALEQKSQQFQAAVRVLEADKMAQTPWPQLPAKMLSEEILAWWDGRRPPWVRAVHQTYRKIGQAIGRPLLRGLSWPVRSLLQKESARPDRSLDDWEEFQQKEQETIVRILGQVYEKLHQWAQVGNEVLQPRVQRLLGGKDREALLARLRQDHRQLPPVDEGFRQFIGDRLAQWEKEHPRAVKLLRSLDTLLAMARPMITGSLFFTGLHLAGEAVGQMAGHGTMEIVVNTALAAGMTGGGEAVLTTTGQTARQTASQLLLSLQTQYVADRQQWLADWLDRHLLAPLLDELRRGARLPEGPLFSQIHALRQELLQRLDDAAVSVPQPRP
ncbi:MAG TPA: 50S ribosome-binding GTPase [Thermoguttaceae bacterium]|nr:50S ribosome-binding GTPase [Thermoguttaceae bacterium]